MDSKDPKAASRSRRNVVGGMGAGLAAASAMPAMAQQHGTTGVGQRPPQSAKQNPLTQYPKPPFNKQPQEFPGLASKMDPRPDHGETS